MVQRPVAVLKLRFVTVCRLSRQALTGAITAGSRRLTAVKPVSVTWLRLAGIVSSAGRRVPTGLKTAYVTPSQRAKGRLKPDQTTATMAELREPMGRPAAIARSNRSAPAFKESRQGRIPAITVGRLRRTVPRPAVVTRLRFARVWPVLRTVWPSARMVEILWLMGPRDASVLRLRIAIRPESVLMAVKLRVTERLTAIAMRLPFAQGRSLFRTGRLIATTAEIRPRTEVRTVVAMPSPFVHKNARMGEPLRRTELKIAVAGLHQTAI